MVRLGVWLGGGWRLDQHTDTVATAWNTNVMPRSRPTPNQPPRYRFCFLQRGLLPACSCIRLLLYPASAFLPATWRLAYGMPLAIASSPATALSRAPLPGFLDALPNSAYRHYLGPFVEIASRISSRAHGAMRRRLVLLLRVPLCAGWS